LAVSYKSKQENECSIQVPEECDSKTRSTSKVKNSGEHKIVMNERQCADNKSFWYNSLVNNQ